MIIKPILFRHLSASRYLDYLLNIDKPYFEGMVNQIYQIKLQLNKPSDAEAHIWIYIYLFLTVLFSPKFIINAMTLPDFDLKIFHFWMVAHVVEHPLRDREIVGSIRSRAIAKALEMVPVATLLGAQHYKASSGFSFLLSYIAQLTSHHLQISPKKVL